LAMCSGSFSPQWSSGACDGAYRVGHTSLRSCSEPSCCEVWCGLGWCNPHTVSRRCGTHPRHTGLLATDESETATHRKRPHPSLLHYCRTALEHRSCYPDTHRDSPLCAKAMMLTAQSTLTFDCSRLFCSAHSSRGEGVWVCRKAVCKSLFLWVRGIDSSMACMLRLCVCLCFVLCDVL